MKLNDYLSRHGQKSELARLIGVPPILVTQWSLGQRPVPAKRAVQIEQATLGVVTRQELCPDSWQDIWPELTHTSAARSCAASDSAAQGV